MESSVLKTDNLIYKDNCSINVIYKLPEAAQIGGWSIYELRYEMGALMAGKAGDLKRTGFDFACPVPNTGIPYAKGFADASGLKYTELLKKTSAVKSFHIEDMLERKRLLEKIIEADEGKIEGKKICLVDEAIFTGITLKIICSLLKKHGAAEIAAVIPTSPCKRPCRYFSIPAKQMLLENRDKAEAASLIGADTVLFQEEDIFKKYIEKTGMTCTECFYGD